MTREQNKATRLALQRYGTRYWARNPVERSWRDAIEQGVAYYQEHDPVRAELFELRYVQNHTARRPTCWNSCTSAARPTKRPTRTF